MYQAPLDKDQQADNRIADLSTSSKILYWFAGVSAEDMARLSTRTRLKLAALGLAFVIGLIVLVFAWVHVGHTYFGWIGVIVPGLAVPAAMILGLDRLIAMQPRRLTGELAAYNQVEQPGEADARKTQRRARMATALVFSAITVYTLLLSMSQDSIQHAQREASSRANAQLRSVFEQRIQAAHALSDGALAQRLTDLQTERATLVTASSQADAAAKTADAAALKAQNDASREAGGLDGRDTGTGPKYRAQREIEAYQNAEAAKQQLKVNVLRQRIDAIDRSITSTNAERNSLKSSTDASLRGVPQAIMADPTYVRVKSGLFADSSAFIRLYADPEEGPGHWLLTLLLAPFLFALECVPLLALALYGSSAYDVFRMAESRAEAAGAVAAAEMLIARRRAAMPPVGVAYPRYAARAAGPTGAEATAATEQPAAQAQVDANAAANPDNHADGAASAGNPQKANG